MKTFDINNIDCAKYYTGLSNDKYLLAASMVSFNSGAGFLDKNEY